MLAADAAAHGSGWAGEDKAAQLAEALQHLERQPQCPQTPPSADQDSPERGPAEVAAAKVGQQLEAAAAAAVEEAGDDSGDSGSGGEEGAAEPRPKGANWAYLSSFAALCAPRASLAACSNEFAAVRPAQGNSAPHCWPSAARGSSSTAAAGPLSPGPAQQKLLLALQASAASGNTPSGSQRRRRCSTPPCARWQGRSRRRCWRRSAGSCPPRTSTRWGVEWGGVG